MKTFYVIVGPDSGSKDQQYWNSREWEWTEEFGAATRYDGQVFFMPLPPGTEGIMEFNEEGEPIRWFEPYGPPLPGEVAFGL